MKTSTSPIKVADIPSVCGGYSLSADYDAVEHFNTHVLPLLKRLGLFVDRSIPSYYGLNKSVVFAAYLRQIEKESQELSSIGLSLSIKEAKESFDKFLDDSGCTLKVRPVSQPGLAFVSYDEKAGQFVLDAPAYRESMLTIYANTPEERKAYELLQLAVSALSALKLDRFKNLPSDYTDNGIALTDFIDLDNGKVSIRPTMYPGPWKELVTRISK